jgi:hypothetical protein
MGDHGRTIPLDDDSTITLYVDPNNLDLTLEDALLDSLEHFRAATPISDFSILELEKTRLGGLPAYRYRATRETETAVVMQETVVSVGPSASLDVSVSVTAPSDRFQRFRSTFRKLIQSFRFIQRP